MKPGLAALLISCLFLSACGGGGGSGGGGGLDVGQQTPVAITVSPPTAQLTTGQSIQFSCAVTGSTNTQCTWSVQEGAAGGTITAGGAYTAPANAGTYRVVATAAADTTKTAIATVTVTAAAPAGATPWVTGYYAGYYWDNMYPPQEVDMSAMTHFVFARAAPGGGTMGGQPGEVREGAGSAHEANHPFAPDARPVENYLVDRAHAAGAKALLMLGGDDADGIGFNLSTADNIRPTFVDNLVDYLVTHDYDGVDIDWENRLEDGCSAADCGTAVSGAESLRRVMALIRDVRAEAATRPRYRDRPIIITFPGYAVSINFLEPGGRVKQWQADIANMVDQYNLMSYGIGTAFSGGGWDSWFTGPIFGATGTRPIDLDSSIRAYVATGVPRSRIGIGIGFYGIYYGAQIRQPRTPTNIANLAFEPGDRGMEYNTLVELGYLNNGTYVFDQQAQSAYRTYDAQRYPNGYVPPMAPHNGRRGAGYLSYENGDSIAAKGRWVRETGVGGTIIWMVNYGYLDGPGQGGAGGTNPLMAAVKCSFLSRSCPAPQTP